VFFGDPTRRDLLYSAGLKDADVLVVAVDEPEAAIKLVKLARRERPDLHIVARAKGRDDVYKLYQAGANDIVREMFDSSLRAGRYTLEALGLSEYDAHMQERAYYDLDRNLVREMADVWDPDIPNHKNELLVAKAKELSADFMLQMTTMLEQRQKEEKKKG